MRKFRPKLQPATSLRKMSYHDGWVKPSKIMKQCVHLLQSCRENCRLFPYPV